jgi:4-hydroxyphenylpyruvate dioxygenase
MWTETRRCSVLTTQIFFVFSSPLGTADSTDLGQDLNEHLAKHGDGVKDIAFAVTDARGIHDDAVGLGATSVREPTEIVDEYGTVIVATIKAFGDTVHSFVQRGTYRVREKWRVFL